MIRIFVSAMYDHNLDGANGAPEWRPWRGVIRREIYPKTEDDILKLEQVIRHEIPVGPNGFVKMMSFQDMGTI